jgi:nicotinamide riboside kinase
MKVINVLGGPGIGKSTVASGLFYEAKCRNLNVELVTEVAKDLVWEDRTQALGNQAYVFGLQVQRIDRLRDKADVVITDSPFLLSAIYAPDNYPPMWEEVVIDLWKRYDNRVVLLKRGPNFKEVGRVHNLQQSLEIDRKIAVLLAKHSIEYTEVDYGCKELGDVIDSIT